MIIFQDFYEASEENTQYSLKIITSPLSLVIERNKNSIYEKIFKTTKELAIDYYQQIIHFTNSDYDLALTLVFSKNQ